MKIIMDVEPLKPMQIQQLVIPTWWMRKVVRWDDNDTIAHNRKRFSDDVMVFDDGTS